MTQVFRYGNLDPLPQPLRLTTSSFEMDFLEGTLRKLHSGEFELLHSIYAVVRDENWETVPAVSTRITFLDQEQSDGFKLEYERIDQQADIHFGWQGKVKAKGNTLGFWLQGEALSSFKRNRIGFCVLHPMRCAGLPCQVSHVDGSQTDSSFPITISPHQPFVAIRKIRHQIAPGLFLNVTMEGDTFEMEDQRNWTDASYKTYCTPLDLAFPVWVEKGTVVEQNIRVELIDERQTRQVTLRQESPILLRLHDKRLPLPKIGFAQPTQTKPLSPRAAKLLKDLNPAHLRADIRFKETSWRETLARAQQEGNALETTLELALFLYEHPKEELQAFKSALTKGTKLARLLIFHERHVTSSKTALNLVQNIFPDTDIMAGTDAFFTELNRNRPANTTKHLTYSLNPQVHAFDNRSLIETLAAQAVTIETAKTFAPVSVCVSPITFKMRWNPNASNKEPLSEVKRLTAQRDIRQYSLFGALWTLGSLNYLAEAGAASLSYYETTGLLGLLLDGGTLPPPYPPLDSVVFPLYHVFANVQSFDQVRKLDLSAPLSVLGLALTKGSNLRLLLANFEDEPVTVRLEGATKTLYLRSLDDSNAQLAMTKPDLFWTKDAQIVKAAKLELAPCSLSRLDTV